MALEIVVPQPAAGPDPSFDLRARLDGVSYTLRCRWRGRDGHWYLDVLDDAGLVYYIAGRRLVANFPVSPYTTARTPPGALVLVDSSGAGRDPLLDDLGTRGKLLYFGGAEIGG